MHYFELFSMYTTAAANAAFSSVSREMRFEGFAI